MTNSPLSRQASTKARRGVERVPQQRDFLLDRPHFAHHDRSAMQAGANLHRRAELALVVRAMRAQPSERSEAGAHAGRGLQPPGKRPSGDQLVADVLVDLPIVQNDRPTKIADQAVEQPVEVDLAQAFRGSGLVFHVHDQEDALLHLGTVISPSNEGQQNVLAQKAVHLG